MHTKTSFPCYFSDSISLDIIFSELFSYIITTSPYHKKHSDIRAFKNAFHERYLVENATEWDMASEKDPKQLMEDFVHRYFKGINVFSHLQIRY